MTEEAGKTPLEDIKRASLEHYEKLADAAHCWNNFIPKAIGAYNPELHDQFLSYLDKEIQNCDSKADQCKNDPESHQYTSICSARETLLTIKEKFSQLINNK